MNNATGFEMRLLKSNDKSKLGLKTETWVIHEKASPGASVLQVDLFYTPKDGMWHPWDGCFIRAEQKKLARAAAETRNALA